MKPPAVLAAQARPATWATRRAAALLRVLPLDEREVAAMRAAFPAVLEAEWDCWLAAHRQGTATMFGGWATERPVAIALLARDGPRHASPRAAYPDAAEVVTVAVVEPLRSRGIGSRLLAVCEGLAIAHAHPLIGLAIPVDNVHAYAWCLRLGYAEPRRVEFFSSPAAPEEAPRRFLVKTL